MADYVFHHGASTSAVIAGPGPEGLGEAFIETFEGLGGSNLAFETLEFDFSNADDVIQSVVNAGPPDVLYLPINDSNFEFATLVAGTPELANTQLAFWEDVASEHPDLADGWLLTVLDDSFKQSVLFQAYETAYVGEHGVLPERFGSFGYDAANMIFDAIEDVGLVQEDGSVQIGRLTLRAALFDTAGLDGLTGTISCDAFGDCAGTEFQIIIAQSGVLIPAP